MITRESWFAASEPSMIVAERISGCRYFGIAIILLSLSAGIAAGDDGASVVYFRAHPSIPIKFTDAIAQDAIPQPFLAKKGEEISEVSKRRCLHVPEGR